MFGKRRSKDGQDGEHFEEQQPSGGSFGGPFMPQTPPADLPASRPLYGNAEPTPAGGSTSDDQFAANLDADLETKPPSDEAAGEQVAGGASEQGAIEAQADPEEEPAPVVTQAGAPEPTPPGASKGRKVSKDGDQMLGLLSTIESQLGELQRLKADRESLIDDLEQTRQELEAERATLDEREQAIAALENEARENQRITENMLSEAEKRERELEQAKTEFEEHRNRVEELEQSLDERSVQLESRDAELRRRLEELESRERESEQRDENLRQEISAAFEARIDELNNALESAQTEVEDLRRQLEEQNSEIDRIRSEAEQRIGQREQELLDEYESRLEGEKQSVDERVASLEKELEQARSHVEEAGTAAETERSRREELESNFAELTEQLEASRRESQAASERLETMQSERGDASQAARRSDEHRAELEAELAKTRDQLAEAGRHLSDVQQRAREANEKVESLGAELESIKAQSESERSPSAQTPGVDPAEILKRDRAIELLKSKLDQAMTRAKQLEEQAAASVGAPVDADPQQKAALDALHQKLLAKQQELDVAAHKLAAREKSLEQKDAGSKPMSPMAGGGTEEEREALRKEAEQLFAQREQLADAKAALDRKAKKVAARASKGKAANLMLSAVITMAILAMLSWYGAGQFAQPIHVASIELGADPQATDLDARQLEAWQQYHEALLDDPQFHELAARRLKQRGYDEFGTPSDVRSMVADGLISSESSADGRLTLLYTAPGLERSQRVLDTFSGSLSGFANETRDHRYDGAATAIITPVSADPTPVEDPRMNLFAMLFGGSCAIALFGSMIMWRRMSRDMGQFEDRLADGLELSPAEVGPTEGGASTDGKRLMF